MKRENSSRYFTVPRGNSKTEITIITSQEKVPKNSCLKYLNSVL